MTQPKINYELLALSKLIREGDQELFLGLHPDLFSNQYSQIFKLINKEFSTSHKLPSMRIVESIINDKAPTNIKPQLNAILGTMERVDLLGVDINQILSGLKDKHLLLTMDSKVQELNNCAMLKDVQGVRGVLNSLIEEINLDSVRPTNFMDAMEMEDSSSLISSGIKELDEHIEGVAGLTIVSGTSGGGKSILLLQMAIGMYLQGKNILFVSLELSAQTLGNRLKSFLTGIPFNQVNKGLLTDDEKKRIADAMADFKNRENVFRIVTDPLDNLELLNLIKVEKSLFDLDVVVLDYLNLVMPAKGSVGGWQALSDTARALHRLSMSLGVVTVSASQVNVDKAPKQGKYPEITTRGSSELFFSATLVLFIYSPETDEEGDCDAAVIYIMKNRNGPRAQLLFEKKFATMQFNFVMSI